MGHLDNPRFALGPQVQLVPRGWLGIVAEVEPGPVADGQVTLGYRAEHTFVEPVQRQGPVDLAQLTD